MTDGLPHVRLAVLFISLCDVALPYPLLGVCLYGESCCLLEGCDALRWGESYLLASGTL